MVVLVVGGRGWNGELHFGILKEKQYKSVRFCIVPSKAQGQIHSSSTYFWCCVLFGMFCVVVLELIEIVRLWAEFVFFVFFFRFVISRMLTSSSIPCGFEKSSGGWDSNFEAAYVRFQFFMIVFTVSAFASLFLGCALRLRLAGKDFSYLLYNATGAIAFDTMSLS